MQRQRIGLATDIARDDRDGAELAHHARVAEDDAIEQRPFDVRQRDREEGAPAGRAERGGGFLEIAALRLHQRDQLAGDERRGHEHRREDDAGDREQDLDPVFIQHRTKNALQAVDEEIGDTRDDRRDRERDLDDDQQEPPAREIEFGDRPGGCDTEGGVDRNGDDRRKHREPDRMQCIRVNDRIAIDSPAL